MKNNFFMSGLLLLCSMLSASEGHEENPHFEWIESREVAVFEDGIYIESNKGLMLLNVVEYDQVNDRYLVQCFCLGNNQLIPLEALSYREGR